MKHLHSCLVNPQHGTGAVAPGVTDADLALMERDLHAPDVVAAFCLEELHANCLEELRETVPRSAPSGVKRLLNTPEVSPPAHAEKRVGNVRQPTRTHVASDGRAAAVCQRVAWLGARAQRDAGD